VKCIALVQAIIGLFSVRGVESVESTITELVMRASVFQLK
jgi:hypothetical protein